MSKKVIRIVKTTVSALWWLLLVGGLVLVITLVAAHMRGDVPRVFGYSLINIVSGSMEPALSVGDLIIVTEQEDYEVGDVVVFQEGHIAVMLDADA